MTEIGIDTKTILINLPESIRGYTVQSRDGQFYTIVLNARHSRQTQLKSYKHECDHIISKDYDKTDHVDIIEHRSHTN